MTTTSVGAVYTMEFSVYQSNGELIIESIDIQSIKVSDMNGNRVDIGTVEQGTNIISSQLDAGIYIFSAEYAAPVKTMIK